MLSVVLNCCAKCHYDENGYVEWHHAECHFAEYHYVNVILLSVVLLSVVKLNVVGLSVVVPVKTYQRHCREIDRVLVHITWHHMP